MKVCLKNGITGSIRFSAPWIETVVSMRALGEVASSTNRVTATPWESDWQPNRQLNEFKRIAIIVLDNGTILCLAQAAHVIKKKCIYSASMHCARSDHAECTAAKIPYDAHVPNIKVLIKIGGYV